MADYYELLGVSKSATEDEIKKAYRKLARELHPDTNGGDAVAVERFKEVTIAYETLRDPEKRRQYDMFGDSAARGQGNGDFFSPNFGDIFENIFGQAFNGGFSDGGGQRTARHGEDMETSVTLKFEEAIFGTKKEVTVRIPVTCKTCAGSGSKPGTTPSVCKTCGGSGQVRRFTQTLLGRMMTTSTCDTCYGEGKIITTPCSDCRGEGRKTEERTYLIEIQPGIEAGSTLRLTGKGPAGPRGGYPGNLYVHVSVEPSNVFKRVGQDLHAQLGISISQAALGTKLEFESLDEMIEVSIPPGTQSGKVLRFRGKGVPNFGGRGRGDLLIELMVTTPKDLIEEEINLYTRLAEIRGEKISEPHEHGLFSKIKSAFR